jgi:hypothetical protein
MQQKRQDLRKAIELELAGCGKSKSRRKAELSRHFSLDPGTAFPSTHDKVGFQVYGPF